MATSAITMNASGAAAAREHDGGGEHQYRHVYHITLHPRSKLDGIGESGGRGWAGTGFREASFSVGCVGLHLDYVPERRVQEELQFYCDTLAYPRSLLQPTAMMFGIPGNIVAVSTCLSMAPLRPASLLIALVAMGDLCTLFTSILPMEGGRHTVSEADLKFYVWFHALFALASAFPHYALAFLCAERATVAWRPALSRRAVTLRCARVGGYSMAVIWVLLIPLVADASAGSLLGTHDFKTEFLFLSNVAPGLTIVALNLVTLVGLLRFSSAAEDNESLASQVSIIMATQRAGTHHLTRPALSNPEVNRASFEEEEEAEDNNNPNPTTDAKPRFLSRVKSVKFERTTTYGNGGRRRSKRGLADNTTSNAARSEVGIMRNPANILTYDATSTDSSKEASVEVKRSTALRRASFGRKVSARESDYHGDDVGSWRRSSLAVPKQRSWLQHSSLTRVSLLASLTYVLLVGPLSVATLVYHTARGPDNHRPVDNPLTMLRLVLLYELCAWLATLNNAVKMYVYLLGAPRFRHHFILMMTRRPRGSLASLGSRGSSSAASSGAWRRRSPEGRTSSKSAASSKVWTSLASGQTGWGSTPTDKSRASTYKSKSSV